MRDDDASRLLGAAREDGECPISDAEGGEAEGEAEGRFGVRPPPWTARSSVHPLPSDARAFPVVRRRRCCDAERRECVDVMRVGPLSLAAGESLVFDGLVALRSPGSDFLGTGFSIQPVDAAGKRIRFPPLHLHHVIAVPPMAGMGRHFSPSDVEALSSFRPFAYLHPRLNGKPSVASDITSCGESDRCAAYAYGPGAGLRTFGEAFELEGVLNSVALFRRVSFYLQVVAEWESPHPSSLPSLSSPPLPVFPLSFYVTDGPVAFRVPEGGEATAAWTEWRMPASGEWRMPMLHMHGALQSAAWIVEGGEEELARAGLVAEEGGKGGWGGRAKAARIPAAEADAMRLRVRSALGESLLCEYEPTEKQVGREEAEAEGWREGRYDRSSVEVGGREACQRWKFGKGRAVAHVAWLLPCWGEEHAHSHFTAEAWLPGVGKGGGEGPARAVG